MPESSQNWELFGYDMRNVGRHWVDAWRDLLWANDSPVRRHLDDAVVVRGEDGQACYQAGMLSDVKESDYAAIVLPDDLVLTKTLDLHRAVEVDLAAALALEVNAASPFSADDIGYGWRIVARGESQITVLLAILSKSATMAYLGRRYDIHDAQQQEVWAKVGDEMVVVEGFGEARRESSYRKRLIRAATMIVLAGLVLLAMVGTAATLKAWELQSVQKMAATTERRSSDANRLRASLGVSNALIAGVNDVVLAYPNPHIELSRLTHLLKDEEFVNNFSMQGLEIELVGRAANAASVMERLTDESDYAEVTAPRAITRVQNSQAEQFYLSIRRREGVVQ